MQEREIASGCLQSSEQVRSDLSQSRGSIPAGVRLEDLARVVEPTRRTISGARLAARMERDYQGGLSVIDRVDRLNF